MSLATASPQSPGRSGRPAPKLTTRRATTRGARPFRVGGSVFGAGTSAIAAASSRLTTIVARVAEDARLRGAVVGHDAVPVEVVFADVEERRGVGLEAGSLPASWKLDSSSTQTSGMRSRSDSAGPASIASASVCSIVGPMLPAAATRLPLRSTRSAVSAVVVVLPLVPVTAIDLGRVVVPSCEAIRARPRTGRARPAPAAGGARRGEQRPRSARRPGARPGLLKTRSTPGERDRVERAADELGLRHVLAQGRGPAAAPARESQTRTAPPSRASQRAIARPESPRPRTSAVVRVRSSRASGSPARSGRAAW